MNDDEERELRIAHMTADLERIRQQIEKDRIQADRLRQEMKWEPYKAIAAFVVGVAAFGGLVIAVSHVIH